MSAPVPAGPLVPGFNPDPSVVRVDGVYYLVTSTFEYLPGIPVYSSTDLVEWTHVGNVVTRPEQVDLEDVPTPGGVWAPTIRHRDGLFYVIVTVMLGGRGCVLFTATDPTGRWSDGIVVEAVDGIDPDLAWDDEGNAYVTFAKLGKQIQQVRVDLETGLALDAPKGIWPGTLYAPEGPHLHRRGDDWYLFVAEGGTDRGHVVSVARGPAPDGPFEGCPHNPVLTARSTHEVVQNVGHADLVGTPDGGTALVLLGVRPLGFAQGFSPLGRETFRAEVDWVDGWPQPRRVELVPAPAMEELRFDLSDPTMLADPGWLAVRRTPASVATFDPGTGSVVITADGVGLGDPRPHFLGRRQRHLAASVFTRVDASDGVGGLASRLSEDHWFALEASDDGRATHLVATATLAGLQSTWECELPTGPVQLRMDMTEPSSLGPPTLGGDTIRLSASSAHQTVVLAELDGRYWSFETAKCFTGRVVGLYASGGIVRFATYYYRGINGPGPS